MVDTFAAVDRRRVRLRFYNNGSVRDQNLSPLNDDCTTSILAFWSREPDADELYEIALTLAAPLIVTSFIRAQRAFDSAIVVYSRV